jgi:hypothetical protein
MEQTFDLWPEKYEQWFQTPMEGILKSAIHFKKEDNPLSTRPVEEAARLRGLMTGAFLAIRWIKPGVE